MVGSACKRWLKSVERCYGKVEFARQLGSE
jgi:hypothetical protein